MTQKRNQKQSFMVNVFIILMSQILVKLLGFVYRIVITNVEGFGDMGTGYYNAGYQIYTMLLAISSVGIPNAISKMVSERAALGDYKGAHRVFQAALVLFAGIGFACSLFLYFGADFLAIHAIQMDGVQYTLRALSPSILFVCLSSVIRGYFVGLKNVKATSSSQVIEQIFKCSLSILFVFLLFGKAPEIMAAGANGATAVATILSFVYLLVFYRVNRSLIAKRTSRQTVKTDRRHIKIVMKSILMLSIPISLSSIITAVARVIDTATITRGISAAFQAGIPGLAGIPTAEQLTTEAVRLSGMLSKGDILTNLPLALNIAFATMLVPSISGALAVGDKREASDKISYSFLISMLLILPCALGMIVLAHPIFDLIYPNASLGAELLQLSAVAVIFTALDQTICGSLQGLGRIFVPATGLLCGVGVKIVLNIMLIRQPAINIYGAAISSIACHVTAFLVCFTALYHSVDMHITPSKYLIKPLLASGIMSVAAILAHKLLYLATDSNTVATLFAILIAAVVYAAAVIFLRILNRDEMEQLPKGDKIVRLLQKLGIVS